MPTTSGSMTKQEQREYLKKVAQQAPDGMRLVRFSVENVMKIKFVDLTPKDDVIVVGGDNGQGKTSLLQAIGWLLCADDVLPTDVIRMGKRTGSIAGQLGPFKIVRSFTRLTPEKSRTGALHWSRIKVTGPGGVEYPKRTVLLKLLLQYLSFDPIEFLRLKPIEQFDQIKGMSQIPADLDVIDKEYEADYDLRHDKRVEWNALLARLNALPPAQEGEAVVTAADVEELTRQLQGAAEHNSRVREAQQRQNELRVRAAQLEEEAKRKRIYATDLFLEAQAIDGQIFEIVQQEWRNDVCHVSQTLKEANAVEVGTFIDAEAIAAQLRAAQAAVSANHKAAQRAEVLAEALEAEAQWNAMNTRMEENRERRALAIQSAVLPVKDLTMGDGELYYKGLPFSQASGAERIRVSLELGMAANPKVRVLRFMDGGWDMLDAKSRQLVHDEVKKHGFQLWVEHVGSGPEATVIMTEGEAQGRDVTEGSL